VAGPATASQKFDALLDEPHDLASRKTACIDVSVRRKHALHLAVIGGLVLDGRGLRTVVFAEPWTALFGKPNDGHSRSWFDRAPSHFVQGTPSSGELHVPACDASFDVSIADDGLAFPCKDYERHVRGLFAEADEAGPHTFQASY
jgi:hypothetical protein